MADPEQQPAGAGQDLRARIQERVEQRRQAGQLPREHMRLSPAEAASVHPGDVDDSVPTEAANRTVDQNRVGQNRAGQHGADKARAGRSGAEQNRAGRDGVARKAAGRPAAGKTAAGQNGTVAAVPPTAAGPTAPAGGSGLGAPNGLGASNCLGAPNGLGGPELLAGRNTLANVNGSADPVSAPGTDPSTAQPLLTRQLPGDRPEGVAGRRHAPVAPGPGLLGRGARWALLLAVTALAVFGLRQYVIASYYIPSASMEATLHGCPGCEPDMVLVDKLSYRFKSISRSDVVVFARPPEAPPEDKQLIKRVIGLPGDVVSGHDGHVFVDNKQLLEPYVNPACHGTADFAAVRVPAGRYFVMGDNRCDSFDSRMFGTVPRSAVIGRAFAVIWPVHHLRWL